MNFHLNKVLLVFIIMFLNLSLAISQEKLDDNVFYCHENYKITQILPTPYNSFLASISYYDQKYEFNRSNLFLLFDSSHLIADSIFTKGNSYVQMLDKSTVLFWNSNRSSTYDIKSGKFQLQTSSETEYQGTKNEFIVGKFSGIEIGYFSKAKNRTLKRSKKNVPRFFYIDSQGNKVWINSGKEEVVADQWTSFYENNSMKFKLGDVKQFGDNIFINIPMIGLCYTLNTKSKKINTFKLPIEKDKSWFLTIDKKNSSHYLITQLKDSSYDIYHLNIEGQKRTFLKNVSGYMDLIHDDKAILRKEFFEKGKSYFCYYFEPLYKK